MEKDMSQRKLEKEEESDKLCKRNEYYTDS